MKTDKEIREIKFRAWHKSRCEMLPIVDIEYLMTKGALVTDYKDFVENIYPNIMQYTGLKDKNGVKIYEGDFIKVLGDKCTVFWQQGAFKFQNISNYNIQPLFDFATINKCVAYEVIGNIYENPELLKELK